MLNFYIITTIIGFVASLLASLRISIYLKSINRKMKKLPLEEKILGWGKYVFITLLPVVNIIFALTYIGLFLAEDSTLRKLPLLKSGTEPILQINKDDEKIVRGHRADLMEEYDDCNINKAEIKRVIDTFGR